MRRGVTRRTALQLGAAGAATFVLPRITVAQGAARHGLSVFGDLKYPADFPHFDYVNPTAPKGGTLSTVASQWVFNQNPQTFNTLNTLVLKGDAPVWLENIFDSLMVRAFDEADGLYGLVASGVSISDDGNIYRFAIRPEARFHDGTPLTAQDAAFSFALFKEKGHPDLALPLKEVMSFEANGAGELIVTFSGKQSRDLPLFVAQLPIVSKEYYTANDFEASTMTPPLGCGPYKVGRAEQGRYIDYERVDDYWGQDLPVNVGRNNFDTIRMEFYRDRTVAFEAFKAGEYKVREEFTSRVWATGYDFPAVADGRVKRIELDDRSPSGSQGWFINTRREKFADKRLREALIVAFDFEWTNTNLMFNTYQRTHSFFENSDMKAQGVPGVAEIALLEPYRDQLPDEVFGEAFAPPVSDGSGRDRTQFRRATTLLKEAGWSIEGGRLLNAKGEQLSIEILDDDPAFEPHVNAYFANLKRLGIDARFRVVDAAQYQERLKSFDFDLTPRRYSMSVTPGEAIRLFWGSASASVEGSNNLSGIADPVVDALIDKIVSAESRDALNTACRALDRVLRAGRYWVPHWYSGKHRMALWNEYDRPAVKPRYDRGVMDTWWHSPTGMSDKS